LLWSFPISKIKHFTRIQTTRAFNRVYKEATKVWHTPYFVLFYKEEPNNYVGFVASKKIGNAVHRNRAKRLMRASFIKHIEFLKSGSYILVAKPAILEVAFEKREKNYLHALKKCTAYTPHR
jgi:ribonuclease P protein component